MDSRPGLIPPATRTPPARFVTDVMLELGLAGPAQVDGAVDTARAGGARPEDVLVESGVIDDAQLAHALAERYGLDRLDLDHFAIDPGVAAQVPAELARCHMALPVAVLAPGSVLVAVADPADGRALAAVAAATGHRAVPAVAGRRALRALIDRAAGAGRALEPVPVVPEAAPEPADLEQRLGDAHARAGATEARAAAAEHDASEARRHADDAERRAAEAEERASVLRRDVERLRDAADRLARAEARVGELTGKLARAGAALDAVRDALRALDGQAPAGGM